jgi:osmotically-inducible protein OsmY
MSPSPLPVREPTDWELAHAIRNTLALDRELGPLNLNVEVERRIAKLEGPVPSDHLRRKAVSTAERVPGISQVRSELRVHSAATGGVPAERRFPAVDRPWPTRPALPALAAPVADSNQGNPQPGWSTPALPMHRGKSNDWMPSPEERTWKPAGIRAGLQAPERPVDAPPRVGLGKPIVEPPTADQVLLKRINGILQMDSRFVGVHARVEGGTVRLIGTLATAAERTLLLGLLEVVHGVVAVDGAGLRFEQ